MNSVKANQLNGTRVMLAVWLVSILFLHMNAILKNEDPLQDAQTEGILYDQKMEQEKDGVKAAATPKVIYYGGQGFLTQSSLSKNEKELEGGVAKKKKQMFNWSDWWEEKPAKPDLPEASVADADLQEDAKEASKAEVAAYLDPNSIDSASGESDEPKDDFWTDSESPSLAPEEPSPAKGDDWW
ncbi:MAG TPA: hypothetical protein PLY88_07825 [Candidatus Omnitrophota bacterium]|nr:hypothetical protein [Candidatus Omnitrophota bacterium]